METNFGEAVLHAGFEESSMEVQRDLSVGFFCFHQEKGYSDVAMMNVTAFSLASQSLCCRLGSPRHSMSPSYSSPMSILMMMIIISIVIIIAIILFNTIIIIIIIIVSISVTLVISSVFSASGLDGGRFATSVVMSPSQPWTQLQRRSLQRGLAAGTLGVPW